MPVTIKTSIFNEPKQKYTGCTKKVDRFKLDFSITYCNNLAAVNTRLMLKTQGLLHIGNHQTHFLGPAGLKNIWT